jgi:HTH-type transcriptional regulator/antitoxin HigA
MPATLTEHSKDMYMELVLAFPLRPIRTGASHRRALSVLRDLNGRRGAAARDYKTVLASLILEFERSAHLQLDTSKVTAAEIVLHLLEQRDMSVNALAKTLGISQSSLSDMLNGRRGWSKPAIIRLSEYFGLQPGLFLR